MYGGGADHLEGEDLKVKQDPTFILKKYIEILKSATTEIYWMCHKTNTISYQSSGIFETLRSLKKNIRVQVLIQKTESNKQINLQLDNKHNKAYFDVIFYDEKGIPFSLELNNTKSTKELRMTLAGIKEVMADQWVDELNPVEQLVHRKENLILQLAKHQFPGIDTTSTLLTELDALMALDEVTSPPLSP